MTGHVPHRDREALHGITVVVEGTSGRTWVGRYHERDERGVVMRDVAIHDPQVVKVPREEWVERQRKLGIQVQERYVVLPPEEAGPITPLAEWHQEGPPKPA